ncbi:SH3 domain-containing protein [Winogradskyella undariae]|uniref:SH3 domain-containing protein n=1 Tax=Winogradskyella undariae TaxID=1285465 RepID=UPI0015C7AE08|nr:SH3 domain-containing protein [Winogradskyella undariae]
MRNTLLHIIILLCLCSCKNKNNPFEKTKTIQQIDSIQTEDKPISEKLSTETESDSLTNLLKIEKKYVSALNGLTYREKPDINSIKLGAFDFGTELTILEKTGIEFQINENGEELNGQWVKVKSKIDVDDRNTTHFEFKYFGYVFNGYLSDSLIINKNKKKIKSISELWDKIIWSENASSNLNINFNKISVKQFKEFQSNYKSQITIDSEIKTISGKYFILNTLNSSIKIPCDYNNGFGCYYYKGYLDNLNLYGIERIGSGVGLLALLNSKTDKLYGISSNFDDSYEMPLLSKSKNLIAFYASDSYDIQSEISIYTIENNEINFSKKLYYFNNKWKIKELVWISDNSFALRVYDFINDSGKLTNERYLKATIE